MATLSDDVKQFIVQALACFDTPKQVSEAVNEEFGLVVPRQQVEKYDPTKHAGKGLSKKWRDLFEASRKAWRDGAVEVPIANRVHRLRMLDRMATKTMGMKNYSLAAQMLAQAAKEMGDAYVNRRTEIKKDVPGEQGPLVPAQEYVLRPDEDVPDKPIL